MNAVDASTTVDPSMIVAPILISLILVVALYVWTALALSAVFRKSGEEGWKAWVPILNTIVLLQLGGLALWIAIVFACYRINVAFGFGAGMTVLAALLLPAWATVVGFGSSRWVGAERSAGVRRSSDDPAPLTGGYTPADVGPPPPLPSTPTPSTAAVAGWAPASSEASAAAPHPAPPVPPMPSFAAAASRGEASGAAAVPDEPISFVPVLSGSQGAAPAVPPAPVAPPVPEAPRASSAPDTEPAPALPAPASSARANQGWGGFDLGAVSELTGEVTAAVSGAPQPIAAVPAGVEHETDVVAPAPAVTRVPAARPAPDAEPWAPSRSPLPESDAFPEASGEVSAVAGAPDAGIPRSARTSVSAQHVLPEIPDDVEETVIASRRKAKWALVLPSGSTVDLTADVVLVGRRPAPSTAYPNAQLVEVDDGTVSKTHLRLERHGEEWSATDLHSTNGTILVASDGAEREIAPGAAHRAPGRFLLGDAELLLTPDDASR